MDGRLKAHKIALCFGAYLGAASYPGSAGANSMSQEQKAALEEVQSVIGPALEGLPTSEAVQAFETVRPGLKSAMLQNISPEVLRQLLG